VQFNGGATSPTNVDNPDNMKPDQKDKIFYCFSNVQVNIFCKSDIIDLFPQSNTILEDFIATEFSSGFSKNVFKVQQVFSKLF